MERNGTKRYGKTIYHLKKEKSYVKLKIKSPSLKRKKKKK